MSFESRNKYYRTHIHWFTCDRPEDWLLYKISFRIFAECCHFDGRMLLYQSYHCHLDHKVVPVQDVGWMDGPWWSEGTCCGTGLRALPNFEIWVHLGYVLPKWLWWQYLFSRWYVIYYYSTVYLIGHCFNQQTFSDEALAICKHDHHWTMMSVEVDMSFGSQWCHLWHRLATWISVNTKSIISVFGAMPCWSNVHFLKLKMTIEII